MCSPVPDVRANLSTRCCRRCTSPTPGILRPSHVRRLSLKHELPDSIHLSERHTMHKHLNLWLTLAGVGGFMIYAITVMILAPV